MEENDLGWWILVGIESILITVILAKVWKDRREYRRTGKLPYFSQHIPRLPCCDFMLERIDDSQSSHSPKQV
jgi:hypothetical protein